MRLTVCWFGFELDVTFGPTTVDDEFETLLEDPRGDVTCSPVGFAPTPMPPWDDPGSFHSLDADDDLED